MAKRRELQEEWRQLWPHYDGDWEELNAMVSLDERKPMSRTVRELQEKWEKLILADRTYEKKCDQMRASSWYSILKLIGKNEDKWHAQKYHAVQVAEQMVKSPAGKKILQDTASLVKSLDAHRSPD